jgi:hypothetical protein
MADVSYVPGALIGVAGDRCLALVEAAPDSAAATWIWQLVGQGATAEAVLAGLIGAGFAEVGGFALLAGGPSASGNLLPGNSAQGNSAPGNPVADDAAAGNQAAPANPAQARRLFCRGAVGAVVEGSSPAVRVDGAGLLTWREHLVSADAERVVLGQPPTAGALRLPAMTGMMLAGSVILDLTDAASRPTSRYQVPTDIYSSGGYPAAVSDSAAPVASPEPREFPDTITITGPANRSAISDDGSDFPSHVTRPIPPRPPQLPPPTAPQAPPAQPVESQPQAPQAPLPPASASQAFVESARSPQPLPSQVPPAQAPFPQAPVPQAPVPPAEPHSAPGPSGGLIDAVHWGRAEPGPGSAPSGPWPAAPSASPPSAGVPSVATPPQAVGADDDALTITRSDLAEQLARSVPPDRIGPAVPALLCPAGHVNPPSQAVCRRCGAPLPNDALLVPRPVLGVLRLSTGEVITLDRDVVMGRNPRTEFAGTDGEQRPHVVKLAGAEGDISRSHLRVTLDGWHVLVTDLNSTNGTLVTLPGRDPEQLRRGEPVPIWPGTVVTLTDGLDFRYEVPE